MSNRDNFISLIQIAKREERKVFSGKDAFIKGSIGNYLKFEEISIEEFQLNERYQRDRYLAMIKKEYKQFNKTYCSFPIVSRRPNGFISVLDGQHRVLMAIWSGDEDVMPCQVYNHPKGRSDADCLKVDSEIFYAQNAKRKNPNYVDTMRSGLQFGLPEAVLYNNNLIACGLYIDCLGDYEEGVELKGEYQWRQAVKNYELTTTKKATEYIKQMNDIWKGKFLRGDLIYGVSCLINFLSKATELNGRRERLINFMVTEIPKNKIKDVYDGISGSKTDVLIARRIIHRYNHHGSTAKTSCITEETQSKYDLEDPTL